MKHRFPFQMFKSDAPAGSSTQDKDTTTRTPDLVDFHGGRKGYRVRCDGGIHKAAVVMSADMTRQAMHARGLKYTDGDEKRIKFWLGSVSSVDRAGDVIVQEGWNLTDYVQNPVLLWSHDYYIPAIGNSIAERVVSLGNNLKALEFALIFASATIYPFGGMIENLVDAGFIKASSVGFNSTDWENRVTDGKWQGFIFNNCDLWELSICNIPMNQDALKRALKSMDSFGLFRKNAKPLIEVAFEKSTDWDEVFKSVEKELKAEEPPVVPVEGKVTDPADEDAELKELEKALETPARKQTGTILTPLDRKRLLSMQRQLGTILDGSEVVDDPDTTEDDDSNPVDEEEDDSQKTLGDDPELQELIAVLGTDLGSQAGNPDKAAGGDLASAYLK